MSSNLPPDLDPEALTNSSLRFGRQLGRVYRKWRRYTDMQFRHYGWTEATRAPIILLYDMGEPMRQADMAAELGLDPSALVRIIRLLDKQEMVSLAVDPEDRRIKRISLTDKGRHWAGVIIAKSMEAERAFLAALTDEEAAQMRSAFDKIAARISSA